MKRLGWIAVATTYLFTLITQLPHVYDVYSALERNRHAIAGVDTALGASIAFELSVAIFTLRLIVNRQSERSAWTARGVALFLALSALANASYYFDVVVLDAVVMPLALTLALPFALWLYAEEFSASARAQVRAAQRRATKEPVREAQTERTERAPTNGKADIYKICGCGFVAETQQAWAGHRRTCRVKEREK